MKDILIATAAATAIVGGISAALCAPYLYDRSETRTVYTQGTSWEGDAGIYSHEVGKLGMESTKKLVGYYGGGNPRVIGLGCDGAKRPIIAMEEDLLPRCDAVEPIANHKEYLEQR